MKRRHTTQERRGGFLGGSGYPLNGVLRQGEFIEQRRVG